MSETGTVIAVTATDDDGDYVFDNLPAGNYTVVVGDGPEGSTLTTVASYDVTLAAGEELSLIHI